MNDDLIYRFNNRYKTGNFDLEIDYVTEKTEDGKVKSRKSETIFRTWNKPEPYEDDEFYFDHDDVEMDGYSSVTLRPPSGQRNDRRAMRTCLKIIFKRGKKWLETGKE